MTLIYHGTPMTPRSALESVCIGRAMCVSFFRPDDVEVVEAISPTIMFRQRRFLVLDAGAEKRPRVGGGSRLDALLPVAGGAAVHARTMGSYSGCSWRTIPAQRRSPERLAVRAFKRRAPLAYGRANRPLGPPMRAVRSSSARLDWRSEEGARGLRRLPPQDGRGLPAVRQPLAPHPHDAGRVGCGKLPFRERGQHIACAERTSL